MKYFGEVSLRGKIGVRGAESTSLRKRKTAMNLSIHRCFVWLRRLDLNQRPSGYEPDELPDCSTPRSLAPSSWVLNYLIIFWGLCQYRNFCEIYFFYMVFSSLKHTLNKSRFSTAQTGVFPWISLFSFLSLASLPLLQRWWPTPALWWAHAANSHLTAPSLPKTTVTNNKKTLTPVYGC